jgi:Immunity protein 61
MCYLVRGSDTEGYVLSSSERLQDEQFELFGTSLSVIERHLFAVFGTAIRSHLRLPRLSFPGKLEELAQGYSLTEVDSDGYRWLVNASGSLAKARGRVSSISTLVRLSHLLSNSLADIKISFEDPGGHPLFTL